jgi:hypothetical protein
MKLFYFVLVAGVVLLDGCGASESASSQRAEGCVGPSCQAAAGSKDDYSLVVDTGTVNAGGTTSVTSVSSVNRCGLPAVGCNPDDAMACAHAVVIVGGNGGGGSVGVGSSAGGRTDTDVDAGNGTLACRLLFDNSVPLSQCELTGSGLSGEPCVSRADCAPGYACTTENGTAQCRQYCCGGNDVCPSGTYCDEREVGEDAGNVIKHRVPVCVTGTACRFDDPYPCPAEQVCSCPSGRVCGVVRADSTTACVVPGTGLEGEACPCAAGHVCSAVLGTCVKTCSLSSVTGNAEQCSRGVCQSSTSLPIDVGICVNSVTLD